MKCIIPNCYSNTEGNHIRFLDTSKINPQSFISKAQLLFFFDKDSLCMFFSVLGFPSVQIGRLKYGYLIYQIIQFIHMDGCLFLGFIFENSN